MSLILLHHLAARGFAILGLLLGAYLVAVGLNALYERFTKGRR